MLYKKETGHKYKSVSMHVQYVHLQPNTDNSTILRGGGAPLVDTDSTSE